jgi:RimJ/RimL family protein N-acetyltransferase
MVPVYATYSDKPQLNQAAGDFVSLHVLGEPGRFERYCSMSVIHDGKIVAATLFHGWHPKEGVIELSSASTNKRWLTKPVIRAMFRMPFDIIGAQLAVLRVSERNQVMIDIANRFGFTGYLIPRLRGRDEAEWIFTYSEEQWRTSRYALLASDKPFAT